MPLWFQPGRTGASVPCRTPSPDGWEAHRQEGVDDVRFDGAQGLVLDDHEDLLLLLQVDEVPKPGLLGEPGEGRWGQRAARIRVGSLSAEPLRTDLPSPPSQGQLTAPTPPLPPSNSFPGPRLLHPDPTALMLIPQSWPGPVPSCLPRSGHCPPEPTRKERRAHPDPQPYSSLF